MPKNSELISEIASCSRHDHINKLIRITIDQDIFNNKKNTINYKGIYCLTENNEKFNKRYETTPDLSKIYNDDINFQKISTNIV